MRILIWSFALLLSGGPPVASRDYADEALCRDARERVEVRLAEAAKELGRPFLLVVGECRPRIKGVGEE